jgi:hypothetical protein
MMIYQSPARLNRLLATRLLFKRDTVIGYEQVYFGQAVAINAII